MSAVARRRPLAILAVLVFVALVSWWAREVRQHRLYVPEVASWTTQDPDGMYHARRVERVLTEGWPVAERDAFMNHPHGARVPWPPYYTLLLASVIAPFTPGAPGDDVQRRVTVEQWTASIPMVFGVLASLVVALCGMRVAGAAGGLIAGGYHALCTASIAYSKAGIADHHAWISFLFALVLLCTTIACSAEKPRGAGPGVAIGVGLGALLGVMLGSWVASLLFVLMTQLVLAWLLFDNAREEREGLARFGLSVHLAAALTLLPAVLSSPWKEEFPWIVVNLSWFHLAHLAIGALVFVPLFFLPRTGFAWRRYPVLVAATLFALAGMLALFDAPPWTGMLEGFAWAGRSGDFMAWVFESRLLLGKSGGDFAQAFRYLGFGLAALPLILVALTRSAFAKKDTELRPWLVALGVLGLLAFSQVRFADAFSIPLAVGVAWLVDRAARVVARGRVRGLPAWAIAILAVVATGALQAESVTECIRASTAKGGREPFTRAPRARAVRNLLEWLRTRTEPGGGVLASWSHGHAIEWAANRPSVATGFGPYVGEDGFLAPGRFFLATDPAEARAVLVERDVRHVFLTSRFPTDVPLFLHHATPEQRARLISTDRPQEGLEVHVGKDWLETIGARLMFNGAIRGAGPGNVGGDVEPLRFLRLVHVSPMLDENPSLRFSSHPPAGWIWEHVPGALLEARARPGAQLAIEIDLVWPGQLPTRIHYTDHVLANEDGIARLRVPYATDDSNGDARVEGAPRFVLEGRAGTLTIPGDTVRTGAVVALD